MNRKDGNIPKVIGLGSKVFPAVIVLGIMAAGWSVIHELETGQKDAFVGEVDLAATDSRILALPEAKIKAGRIDATSVGRQPIQHVHTVPGRIRYDESKHVEIRAPISGILAECLVTPGDCVETGQLLAVISSPEIGRARADVLKYAADLALVERQANWQQQVTNNLSRLFAELDSGKTVDELEDSYSEKPLGEYRDKLLTTWSKMLLADELAENARPLAETGSIPGRTLNERETERRVAESAFRTVRDQAQFESRQERERVLNELADAKRLATIARHHLETLLGYPENEISTDTSVALSRLEVRAPFAGSIESRSFARSERLSQSDSMFVLANTSSLYVSANIRENDWPAVLMESGQQLTVSVPALACRSFEAHVHYVGPQVDVDSNSVPLVATIDNRDGLLRPGMFVRVAVPIGEPHETVAVRPQSVMQHENEQFVFVATNGRRFRRVDVVTGLATDDWVEVLSGLEPGQRVVDAGAFLLKSEMLLEGE